MENLLCLFISNIIHCYSFIKNIHLNNSKSNPLLLYSDYVFLVTVFDYSDLFCNQIFVILLL